MKPISQEIVEKTWQEISNLQDMEATLLMTKMEQDQPGVLAYLMAAGDDLLNQDERELLLYLGTVVWQIMLQGTRSLRRVTIPQLESAENTNFSTLDDLSGESPGDLIAAVEEMIADYNQPEVLKYVVEALMEEDDEEIDITEDSKGLMLIYLKTVIDCFDAA